MGERRRERERERKEREGGERRREGGRRKKKGGRVIIIIFILFSSRHCGRLLCNKCTSQQMPIVKFDLNKPVRVCEVCGDSFRISTMR